MNDKTDKPTILIVDDAPIDRSVLARIFNKEYRVETAGNGEQALDRLARLPEVSAVLLDIMMPVLDGYAVLKEMRKNSAWVRIPVMVITVADDIPSQLKALDCGAVDVITKPVNPQVLLHRLRNIISRMELIHVSEQNRLYELQLRQQRRLLRLSELDEKTKIFNRQTFCRKAAELIQRHPAQDFVILRWDIDRFKIFNDTFGTEAGDALLSAIGSLYRHIHRRRAGSAFYGHWEADHFVLCRKAEGFDPAAMVRQINHFLTGLYPSFGFSVRLGIYPVDDRSLDVSLMCDRALLALHSIKGSFNQRFAYYTAAMRETLLSEQVILGEMSAALADGQFHVYFQPQYNYVTKRMTGAEALVRWHHPQRGILSPGTFIPAFERSGFISYLDVYIWEQTCILLRKWLDGGVPVVPVSVNLSRRDIYFPELVPTIVSLPEKYGLTPDLLRLEITESAYMDNPTQLIEVVTQLRAHGFQVEIDDFGSGYSSLNSLKDVPVDILKLDMKFIGQGGDNSRGGSILSSVVRMAHWLKLPVIAEGVETREQADYLKSIDCFLMQGFYFFRPMPSEDYERLLLSQPELVPLEAETETDIRGAVDFLDASTQATLLFNSFVGGAAILEFDGRQVEALRLNDKYFDVLGTTREAYLNCQLCILDRFYPGYRELFIQALKSAIELGRETQCELRSTPFQPGGADIWTLVRVRYLARNVTRYTFYVSVENITERKELMMKNLRLSRELTTVMQNVPGGILNFEITDHIRITYFNDTAAGMFGYGRREFARQFAGDPLRAVHPDDVRQCKMEIKCALHGRKPLLSYKFRHICKDGSWRWVQLTGRIMYRGSHSILASAILIDIHKQVQIELLNKAQAAELEKQRLYLHSLYNMVPCGIIQYAVERRGLTLLSCNDAAWRMFGYDNKVQCISRIGRTGWLGILHPDDAPLVSEGIRRAVKDGEFVELAHRALRMDGEILRLRMLMQKIRASDGSDVLQCVFTHIAEC